jgi:hypothetical protein
VVQSGGVPSGIRTRVTGVKGRRPRPLDDGDTSDEHSTIARSSEVSRDDQIVSIMGANMVRASGIGRRPIIRTRRSVASRPTQHEVHDRGHLGLTASDFDAREAGLSALPAARLALVRLIGWPASGVATGPGRGGAVLVGVALADVTLAAIGATATKGSLKSFSLPAK